MTKARLLVVTAGLAVAALIGASSSPGEAVPAGTKDRTQPHIRPPSVADKEEGDSNVSRFARGGAVSYRTLKGELYFALQVRPKLEVGPVRPRDYVILVSSSAGQAGAPWLAAGQIATGIIHNARPDDRISLWTVSTPEATRCLTRDFLRAKDDVKKLHEALNTLQKKCFPAGDTDLKTAFKRAIDSFDGRLSRQRLILFLGGGMSNHNPISAADRQDLCKTMVERKIAFFAVPLGGRLSPENLHGFATGTGGMVVRTQILKEKLEDVLERCADAFAGPVLYPSEFKLSQEATESYPTQLPPVRGDTPTLVVGRMKSAKALTYTVTGTVGGTDAEVTCTATEKVAGPELDNFFLVSMLAQWKNARTQPALIRGDRALALAFEQNRLQHHELLLSAELAVQENKLEAAARLFEQAKQLAPHDPEADAGIRIVANLRAGKLTRDMLRHELEKEHAVDRLQKVNGQVRWARQSIIQLAQLDQDNEAKVAAPGPAAVDGADLLQARKDRIVIEEQRMAQTVDAALRQARRDLGDDPDQALDLLRNTLLQVRDHPDLGDRVRDALMTRLQASLRDVTSQGRTVKLRQQEQRLMVDQVKKRQDEERQRQTLEERSETQYRLFKGLMNVARVEEKARQEVLDGLVHMANEARLTGQPVPVATQAAYDTLLAGFHLQQMNELKRKREERFLSVMLSVEKSHVPFSDEPGIYFPPLSTWEAIRKTRKDKYESSSLPVNDKGRGEAYSLKNMLEEEVDTRDFSANPMSLKEALGLLMEKFAAKNKELPILVDAAAFKEENPEGGSIYDTQVQLPPFPKKLRLATMLRFLLNKLDPPNATYMIRRSYIEITTIDHQTRERVLRVYPVGDLVIPISMQMGLLGGGRFRGMRGGMMMGGMGMMGMGGGMMGMMGMGGGMMGMMGMGGGMMGMMGMGGMMMGGMMMGGMNMMGMGGMMMGGMNMMGMGMGGMMMGGMNMMGMGGMGMMGMGGMMMGGGMMRGMTGGNFRGGAFMGGFNGGLGLMGAINAPTLIMTITQVVAPNEWFVQQQPQPFNQFLGGGLNNFMGGVGVIGGQALGNIGNPVANLPQGAPVDPSQANTIQFFPPSLALIVRAPSRIHVNYGGLIGGKQKRVEAAMDARDRGLDLIAPISPGELRARRNKAAAAAQPKKAAAAKAATAAPGPDPATVWQNILDKESVEPGLVIATVDLLFESGKFAHAVEFLKANLRRGIVVRPWVYEALALALESSGGDPADVRRARLSAVALDPKDGQSFLRAARTMADFKQWDRALAFCRRAADLEPNLAEPYAEALAYAELGKDSRGMEWAADRLLGQDWPVDNQGLQLRAQTRLEALSRVLRSERRGEDAARLRSTLERLRERDLVIKLSWENGTGPSDLDLIVKEPCGSICALSQRQTPGGGILTGNTLTEMNHATYLASRALPGEYEITIQRNWGQPLGNHARLEIIQHLGTPQEIRRLQSVRLGDKQSFKVTLKEGRRTELAVVPPLPTQRPRREADPKGPSVREKLRALAHPDFAEAKVIRSAAWTPGAHLPAVPAGPSRGPERTVFQTAIPSTFSGGVNLNAQATLSADQSTMRLHLNPVFQTVGGSQPGVRMSLIPGGDTP
jgi:tetratricopeptide (TPR) repeat protein